jgi:hypothetical protein
MIGQGFPCAVAEQKPDATNYIPRPLYRAVCHRGNGAHAVPRMLADYRRIGPTELWRDGCGIDLDLPLRARNAGYGP